MTQSPGSIATGATDLTALVGLKLGNYRLVRLLGRGRMGVVYLAEDEALLRPTAIKLLSWSVAEAQGHDPVKWFLAEARMVARINHPKVVQIYAAARHGNHCYIAMEYVAGQSAEALVASAGPLSCAVATNIVLQAAAALHAAHSAGIIHRDVKPANLMVGDDGSTKLGDFGMALGFAELRTGTANVRVGTPYYQAPEIWRGQAATAASDVYSLGATYFQLLTGRPPFAGADVATLEQAHLTAPTPDVRELAPRLPASCAALVRRALAKLPRDRYPSAVEVMHDAERIMAEIGATPSGNTRDTAPAPRRRQAPSRPGPGAPGPLLASFGLASRPFAAVDAATAPYLGEPFTSVRKRLLATLEREGLATLVGAVGSGRSLLCARLAEELSDRRRVWVVGGDGPAVTRACEAVGVPAVADEAASILSQRLSEDQRPGGRPLLVIDDVGVEPAGGRQLRELVAAARRTRAFELLLVGDEALGPTLEKSGIEVGARREVRLPPLDAAQIAAFVRAWVDAALTPAAPPVVFSPDALFVVAFRTQGVLERIGLLGENMLVLAASEHQRTLTSWHAWAASDRERWHDSPTDLPRRPATWPTPEVADVLDACRRAAGMPPFPRVKTNGDDRADEE